MDRMDLALVESLAGDLGADMNSRRDLVVLAAALIRNGDLGKVQREEEDRAGRKERARDKSSHSRSRRDSSAEKRTKRSLSRQEDGEEEDEEGMEH